MESNKSSKAKWMAAVMMLGVIVGGVLIAVTSSNHNVRIWIMVVLCLISFIAGKLSSSNKKDNKPDQTQ